MRSLSATLSSAQAGLDKDPIWKVVLSRSGQTTRGYDRTRIRKISQVEMPDGVKVVTDLKRTIAVVTVPKEEETKTEAAAAVEGEATAEGAAPADGKAAPADAKAADKATDAKGGKTADKSAKK